MDTAAPQSPAGLDNALLKLKETVDAVLRRLPAPSLDPRYGIAYVTAPWLQNQAAGVAREAMLAFDPETSDWPDQVRACRNDMEATDPANLLWPFRRGDLSTPAFGKVVEDRVREHDRGAGMRSFTSAAVRSGAHDFVAIVEFDAEACARYPAVTMMPAIENPTPMTVSLLNSAIFAALAWYCEQIARGLGERRYGYPWHVDAILRHAGTALFAGMQRILGVSPMVGGDLFLALDAISALTHESRPCLATVVLSTSDRWAAMDSLRFRNAVPLREALWARKLLETAASPFQAICDGRSLLGLGAELPLVATTATEPAGEFTVRFEGEHRWSLASAGIALADFRLGFPSHPAQRLERTAFEAAFRRVFPEHESTAAALWPSAEAILATRKGALLVITSDAEREAARLAPQGTAIIPTRLSELQLGCVCRIDGALLLDPTGICHAIGVILDGNAIATGSRSRGARFNSAIRYVHDVPGRLAIVCSEDGRADLVPRLRPQVRRSNLDRALEEVRGIGPGDAVENHRTAIEQLILYSDHLDLSGDEVRHLQHMLGESGKDDEWQPPDFDPHASDVIRED